MGLYIWMKQKHITVLSYTVHPFTVIAPHNHIYGLDTFSNIQVFQ
jgi:hypothetical protein